MNNIDASVVIGFRDWGAERIRRSALSILNSFNGLTGEVIISDYGSSDPNPAKHVAEQLGVKYVYTPGDKVWSRSRALNAGFALAEGDLLISTDADMLFSPRAMRRIIETAREAEHCALFLQCRDLPSSMGDEYFGSTEDVDWEKLEREGRLRPRWGMGGMMAISSQGYTILRGFDERLHTYGGEDLDFAQRARRAGYRTVWVDDPDVRMYHMWHPPTLRTVEKTESGREAVQFNKQVVYKDKTFTRNLKHWRFRPASANPLVSIVYSTRNRAELLKNSIESALTQSVQDFEIIVVDDGPEDDSTELTLSAFRDARIRYFRQEPKGISAARNLALRVSKGYYTAVMDDDDLMHPRRLEWQLESLTADYVGTVGSFVNFDDETGALNVIVSKNPTLAQAAEKGGAPGHGTWLLRTDVMRAIGYDETISSGVDNNFFLRLLRTGYRVAHSGKPVLLRRMHNMQVTALDSTNQTDAAKQALQFFQYGLSAWHKTKLEEEAKANAYPLASDREVLERLARAFLPDHLVERNVSVRLATLPSELPQFDGVGYIQSVVRDGDIIKAYLRVSRASYSDMVKMSKLGFDLDAEVLHEGAEVDTGEPSWEAEALDDYLGSAQGEGVVALYKLGAGQDVPEEAQVYSLETDGEVGRIAMRSLGLGEAVNSSPWVIVGSTAEEYWA